MSTGCSYDYLDFITSLDWKPQEMQNIDLKEADADLDEDH